MRMATTKKTTGSVMEIPPEAKKSTVAGQLTNEGPTWLAKAHALEVTNPDQHAAAIELLTQTAYRLKIGEEERVKITGPLHLAWKNANTFFAGLLEPFASVNSIVRGKVLTYERAERAKAEALRIEGERKARLEREKKEAQAKEAQRLADDQARQQREEAARKQKEKDDALKEAERLRMAGDAHKAAEMQKVASDAAKAAAMAERKAEVTLTRAADRVETLQQQAQSIVAPIVDQPVLKATGRVSRKVYRFELLDITKVDPRYLTLNEEKVRKIVAAMKLEAVSLIGEGSIRVWEEDDLSIKAAK